MRLLCHAAMGGLLFSALAGNGVPCRVPAAMQPQPRTEAGLRAEGNLWLQALPTQNRELLHCILSEEYLDSDWQGDLRTKTMMLEALAGMQRCIRMFR